MTRNDIFYYVWRADFFHATFLSFLFRISSGEHGQDGTGVFNSIFTRMHVDTRVWHFRVENAKTFRNSVRTISKWLVSIFIGILDSFRALFAKRLPNVFAKQATRISEQP